MEPSSWGPWLLGGRSVAVFVDEAVPLRWRGILGYIRGSRYREDMADWCHCVRLAESRDAMDCGTGSGEVGI